MPVSEFMYRFALLSALQPLEALLASEGTKYQQGGLKLSRMVASL